MIGKNFGVDQVCGDGPFEVAMGFDDGCWSGEGGWRWVSDAGMCLCVKAWVAGVGGYDTAGFKSREEVMHTGSERF